jgi:hypothetical protein
MAALEIFFRPLVTIDPHHVYSVPYMYCVLRYSPVPLILALGMKE